MFLHKTRDTRPRTHRGTCSHQNATQTNALDSSFVPEKLLLDEVIEPLNSRPWRAPRHASVQGVAVTKKRGKCPDIKNNTQSENATGRPALEYTNFTEQAAMLLRFVPDVLREAPSYSTIQKNALNQTHARGPVATFHNSFFFSSTPTSPYCGWPPSPLRLRYHRFVHQAHGVHIPGG